MTTELLKKLVLPRDIIIPKGTVFCGTTTYDSSGDKIINYEITIRLSVDRNRELIYNFVYTVLDSSQKKELTQYITENKQ